MRVLTDERPHPTYLSRRVASAGRRAKRRMMMTHCSVQLPQSFIDRPGCPGSTSFHQIDRFCGSPGLGRGDSGSWVQLLGTASVDC